MSEKSEINQRTLEAAQLQAIEDNPLDAEDFAMFEMFDRESLSFEEQLAYVRNDLEKRKVKKSVTFASAAGR